MNRKKVHIHEPNFNWKYLDSLLLAMVSVMATQTKTPTVNFH